MDLLEKGLAASNFAMLGLGDIVIPGDLQSNLMFNVPSFQIVKPIERLCARQKEIQTERKG